MQARREAAHALAIHSAVRDQPDRTAGHVGAAVPGGRAGRGVGVAALAGSEAALLGGRGAAEEAYVAAARQPGRAARPAVHARGRDGHDEEAVVARIATLHEAVAALEVLDHESHPRMPRWRFSDMPVGRAPGGDSVGWVHTVDTPIGPLLLSADDGRLSRVEFGAASAATSDAPPLPEAEAQLNAYFAGELERFELPLAPRRDRLPAKRLGRTHRDPLRNNHDLLGARGEDRPAERLPRRGCRQREQPAAGDRALPPRDRSGRSAHRIRRRTRAQTAPACVGGGESVRISGHGGE